MRIVPRMAKSGANGAAETLRRLMPGARPGWMPPQKGGNDPEIADRVEPERRGNAEPGDDDTSQGGTDRAADVDADSSPPPREEGPVWGRAVAPPLATPEPSARHPHR